MPQHHHAILPIAAFSDNYVWMVHDGVHAVVVDPGQAEPVREALARLQLSLTAILLTHHHNDHVGGVSELVQEWQCPVWGPATESLPVCDHPVKEGDVVTLVAPEIDLRVLDVPGHTAGHVAYAGRVGSDRSVRNAPVLFSGDTLFAGGCGRLFEGTPGQMATSLGKMLSLPPDTRVYCGHEYTLSNLRWAVEVEGDNVALQEAFLHAQQCRASDRPTLPSTLAQECATNPFVRTEHAAVANAAARWAGKPLASPVEVFAALREWKNQFK